MEPRTLLVVSGGPEALPTIAEARRMGLRVVVSDAVPDAPGFRLADAGLLASVHDPDATLDAARAWTVGHRLDGVIAPGTHCPTSVAAVASLLGLPGPSLAAARCATDKLALRERLAGAGVPVPAARQVECAASLARAVQGGAATLLVKPVDGRGARGVVRMVPGVDSGWAFATARRASPQGRVLAEEFVDGPHVRAVVIVVDGRVYVPALSDRGHRGRERFAPFVHEDGGDTPSALDLRGQGRVHELIDRAIAALGITHGVAQIDVVMGAAGPVVVEVALRLSGGFLCSHEVPLATGVNVVRAAIRLALGERPDADDIRPRWDRGVAQRWLYAPPGRVVAIDGVEAVAAGEGIALLAMRIGRGSLVCPPRARVARGGVIVAVGGSRAEAAARAEAARARIRIATVPVAA